MAVEALSRRYSVNGSAVDLSSARIIMVTHQLPWGAVSPASAKARSARRGSQPLLSTSEMGSRSSFGSVDLTQANGADGESHGSWTLQERRGHSAIHSGIQSMKDKCEVVQVGWPGHVLDEEGYNLDVTSMDQDSLDELHQQFWDQKKCVPVLLDERVAQGHYEGYCKAVLWPLFHYLIWDYNLDSSQFSLQSWSDYQQVNQKFAEAIARIYQPGDLIWIHDYHLLLLPSMVRELIPNAAIGFFLHTPFPSSELFRCLPERKEILEGVLGSSMIGFQTYSYARHFLSSCTRVLGLESSPKGVDYKGSQVSIHIFPIGIDPKRLQNRRQQPSVTDKMAAIREMYAGKKIIVGRDKLDHVKGVQHKLNAFHKFLTTYPEWQNKVVLIQVTSPSEREIPKLEAKVTELVARINGNFGSLEFAPVHHYHQHLDQDDYYALLSVADVGLITSVRDGMNTTSHEFVVCQQENRGALILSEFTGTAGSLSAATLVNPWDYVGVANAINEALSMSKEERSTKHQQLFDHVTSNTAAFWAESFVRELKKTDGVAPATNPTPALDVGLCVQKYRKAQKRLLMFDYDGTLTPIRKTPGAAVPPPEMLRAMQVLASDPRNVIYVISGRDQACLENWLGSIQSLGLSAEHGCFLRPPDGKWANLSEDIDFSWKTEVTEIFNYYTERTQGSFVEHKRCSVTWHYRLADPEYGIFQAKECQNHLENAVLSKLPIEILIGKKNLEVRPISINKGEIVKRLMKENPSAEFVFCAGDDRTDEDMFKMVRQITERPERDRTASGTSTVDPASNDIKNERLTSFNVTIGPATKKTHAGWHVPNPEELIKLMGEFAVVSKNEGAQASS